jgi:hypothetical protein
MNLYFYMCSNFEGRSVVSDLVKIFQDNGLVLTMEIGKTQDGKLGHFPYRGEISPFVDHAHLDEEFTNPTDLEYCFGPRIRIETITRLKYPEPDIPRRDYITLTCFGMMLGPNYNYVSTLLNFGTAPEAPDTESPFFEAGAQLMSHLGNQLFVYLKPMYGWLDYSPYDFLSGAAIRDRKELDTFYWGNYFGKDYIDKYGSNFLLNTPCWQKEILVDGSIYLQASKFYTKPVQGKQKKMLEEYLKPNRVTLSENPFSFAAKNAA